MMGCRLCDFDLCLGCLPKPVDVIFKSVSELQRLFGPPHSGDSFVIAYVKPELKQKGVNDGDIVIKIRDVNVVGESNERVMRTLLRATYPLKVTFMRIKTQRVKKVEKKEEHSSKPEPGLSSNNTTLPDSHVDNRDPTCIKSQLTTEQIKVRNEWKVGSTLDIFSLTQDTWRTGKIVSLESEKNLGEIIDWFKVEYPSGKENEKSTKTASRYSKRLRPVVNEKVESEDDSIEEIKKVEDEKEVVEDDDDQSSNSESEEGFEELQKALSKLGLKKFAPIFYNNGYTVDFLSDIPKDELTDMGIVRGFLLRFRKGYPEVTRGSKKKEEEGKESDFEPETEGSNKKEEESQKIKPASTIVTKQRKPETTTYDWFNKLSPNRKKDLFSWASNATVNYNRWGPQVELDMQRKFSLKPRQAKEMFHIVQQANGGFDFCISNKTADDGFAYKIKCELQKRGMKVWQQQSNRPKLGRHPWQKDWFNAAKESRKIICIISEGYCESDACLNEFSVAGNMQKRVVILTPHANITKLKNCGGKASSISMVLWSDTQIEFTSQKLPPEIADDIIHSE